jgi:hypothetical protein
VARLVGPDEGSRAVYTVVGGIWRSAAGLVATVYSDSNGTVPADILTQPGGSPISGSQVTVDGYSRLPLFQFPDGVDVLYASINGGPVLTITARSSASLLLAGNQTAAGVKTFSDEPVAPSIKITGTIGAPQQGRFVGVTTSGAPTSGTYAVGDFCLTQNGQMFVCVGAGTPGTWITPSDLRDCLTTGEEAFHRDLAVLNSLAVGTGDLRLSFFTARKSETTTQVRVVTGGTAAGATPTVCRIGLYEVAANGNGTLVASTTNDTTLFAATNTAYTKAWSSSYAKVAGKRYAVGICVVTGATAPQFCGTGFGSGGAGSEPANVAPRLSGSLSGQSDLPSSFTEGALGPSARRIYAAILP